MDELLVRVWQMLNAGYLVDVTLSAELEAAMLLHPFSVELRNARGLVRALAADAGHPGQGIQQRVGPATVPANI